eukprot:1159631-Pelagomonas_calceolata.AAC.1
MAGQLGELEISGSRQSPVTLKARVSPYSHPKATAEARHSLSKSFRWRQHQGTQIDAHKPSKNECRAQHGERYAALYTGKERNGKSGIAKPCSVPPTMHTLGIFLLGFEVKSPGPKLHVMVSFLFGCTAKMLTEGRKGALIATPLSVQGWVKMWRPSFPKGFFEARSP